MLSAFSSVLHVPNLNEVEHVISVLEQSDVFSKKELSYISDKLRGRK